MLAELFEATQLLLALLAISLRFGDRPQLGVDLPSPDRHLGVEFVESPGGISPPGAPRTVHDPLESHGSRCSAVAMT